MKKAILDSFDMETTKIDLMSNNHFNILGEISDPESLLSVRVQVIKERTTHQVYIDLTIFSEILEIWPMSKFLSKLQEVVKPDKIAINHDQFDLTKGALNW
ncbi:MAG TPA: hypothetical protein EYO59_00505 [Chromatiaceae bacterium]|nr:hypothetical protein [Chromatiaceae bacterium]